MSIDIKKFRIISITGKKEDIEDMILDLQNEYPEWFVVSSDISNYTGKQVVKLVKEIKE